MSKSKNSLYLCDFPKHLERVDIHKAFYLFDGYLEARIARDKTGQKISFVDFSSESAAKEAMHAMKGFKFQGASRGLNVRFSDNSSKRNNHRSEENHHRNNSVSDSDRRHRSRSPDVQKVMKQYDPYSNSEPKNIQSTQDLMSQLAQELNTN